MKKQKAKKTGGKKEEKVETVVEPTKEDENVEPEPELATESTNGGPSTEEQDESTKDAEEKVPDLNAVSSHHRAPSVSQQSKMRSSSFRQSGGLTSPGYFPREGDTAPDIHRKQAVKIEELEKENKRLAKEASEGEKRWKKAEEELEELREAEADSPTKPLAGGSSGEVEKLVSNVYMWKLLLLMHLGRKQRSRLCSAKILNCKPNLRDAMAHLHLYQ